MNQHEAALSEAESLLANSRWQEAARVFGQLEREGGSGYRHHMGHGLALLRCGHPAEAHGQFELALAHRPDSLEALSHLSACLSRMGRSREAEQICRRILERDARHLAAWSNLGSSLCHQGRVREGIEAFREAHQLAPEDRIIRDNLLLNLNYLAMDGTELAAVHRTLCASLPSSPRKPPADPAGRRIRVGYVSSDFRSHSVSFFMPGPLLAHDRQAFEIFCYSTTPSPDRRTADFQQMAEHFADLSASSDLEAARRIEADAIDVLVDLGGHTSGNRLDIFARRPAPVQATYLGYPATTGCSFMDFRLVDALTDPEGAEAHATERLVRLPAPFLCYHPHTTSPPIAPPPVLTNGFVTYGSFNHTPKVSDLTLDLWSQVLAAVPESRMVLKAREFSDPEVGDRFRAQFSVRGIDPSRLTFLGLLEDPQAHLAAYGQIDVALDTYPYHGTTTTCEALWMGVPVVSLVGTLHAARVASTLLGAVGLEGLAVDTPEDYVALAAALPEDRTQLAGLRARLRTIVARSPLCDRERLTLGLEEAYRFMLANP